ncbi:helix-turn-helix domain-containing protein [Streptomyces sp. SP17BM10]|uniref:helix-turn-helix domain-containing protein n=1 Tax=Streptomyces sp. SP17BM10 TaxID=3002530 RepID=UPI002E79D359|nr:helix-turn-helix domain-containing protein [Streptomyces sp. SP17BM10]MEE1781768.1 helix-turn-helix domain-containing protein [Streptomyces sp. SP17BM10]
MLSGRGYRLEPDVAQAESCEEFGGIRRSVWNPRPPGRGEVNGMPAPCADNQDP